SVVRIARYRAVRVPVNHRTGMYRPYRAVQGGTENLGLKFEPRCLVHTILAVDRYIGMVRDCEPWLKVPLTEIKLAVTKSNFHMFLFFSKKYFRAALLLKLETRIAEVAIESRELGFTRPGDYIYEFLSDLNITRETANMLVDTIDNAALLLEEGITSPWKIYFSFHEL
ncbi:hypothetical protein GW17_00044028, partial [Ensete ventricosum]